GRQHFRGPRLRLTVVLMGSKDFALGREDPDALVLVLLLLGGAEENPARILRHADAVEVHGNGNEVLGNAADDAVIGERARTEPGGVASAALQGIIAGDPEEDGPALLAGNADSP